MYEIAPIRPPHFLRRPTPARSSRFQSRPRPRASSYCAREAAGHFVPAPPKKYFLHMIKKLVS